MATDTLLLEVGVLFTAVAIVGAIARRLDQSVIPFYIVVGMLLGEHVAGTVELPVVGAQYVQETEFVEVGAELGIVFLLFFLGIEFNLDRLLESRALITRAGIVDLVVNFGAGLALGYVLFDGAALPAFLLAGIVYISSSAIITKSLIDQNWIANAESGPMLGTLVFEDLFIAVYLAVATALVLGGGSVSEAAASVGVAVGFILLLLLVVSAGTGLFQRAIATDSNEFLVLRGIGITVLIAGAALAVGVSEAVAAFFVGMAFSSTDYVDDLEELLEPIRDTFAAVFFFWIGLVTDPTEFLGVLWLILVGVIVTTPTKLLSGYLGGRIYGLSTRRSTRVGLGMVTRGEFSLIVASILIVGGDAAQQLPATVAPYAADIRSFTVGYVLVMSILGTMLMQYSERFERIAVSYLGE